MPDSIEYIKTIPAIAIRIDRAAKGLSRQFAHRYISKYSYGLLIYPQVKEQYLYSGNEASSHKSVQISQLQNISSLQTALRTTLDNTTYISDNFIPLEDALQEECIISLAIDNQLYRYKMPPSTLLKEKIYELIERITLHSSLKTGDLLFIELEPETIQEATQVLQGSVISLTIGQREILNIPIR